MRNRFLSRCFAPPGQWAGDGTVALDPEESRHLARVLHARPGDRVEAFDGEGRRGACRVLDTGRIVRLAVEQTGFEPPPAHEIRLAVGWPREDKLEWLLQKGTELGLCALFLFPADRSVAGQDPETGGRRQARWERIIRDAAKQSGRCRLPRLERAPDLAALLRVPPGESECRMVGSLTAPAGSLRAALERERVRGTRVWTLWIGPEGDFSPAEWDALRAAGIIEVSLGPRVLRVETAGLYALSCLLYETEPGGPA